MRDVLLARVTTQPKNSLFDISLANWQQAGLLAPSIVRVHKLATIAKSRVMKRLGTLTSSDRQQVAPAFRQIAGSW